LLDIADPVFVPNVIGDAILAKAAFIKKQIMSVNRFFSILK